MKKLFNWIYWSSKDPQKVSLTVKMGLLASIPYILQTLGVTCALGIICFSTTESELKQLFDLISAVVLFALLIVSHLGLIVGIVRKIFNTMVK